jgi:hypothetical protein
MQSTHCCQAPKCYAGLMDQTLSIFYIHDVLQVCSLAVYPLCICEKAEWKSVSLGH